MNPEQAKLGGELLQAGKRAREKDPELAAALYKLGGRQVGESMHHENPQNTYSHSTSGWFGSNSLFGGAGGIAETCGIFGVMAKVEAARGASGGAFPSSSSSVGMGGAMRGGMGGSFPSCRAGADSSYRAGSDPAFEEWATRQGYSHLLPSPCIELPVRQHPYVVPGGMGGLPGGMGGTQLPMGGNLHCVQRGQPGSSSSYEPPRPVEMREAQRRAAEWREAEQREVQRREAEQREVQRREAERREVQRREAEQREVQRREAEPRLGQTPTPVPVPLAELAAATAGWAAARKVGEGGFGVVYRADALPSRPVLGPVAIKRLGADSQQGLNELMSEVQLLGTCRHEHLLPLLAFCYEGGVGCLVYPLMAGGSLEDRLVRDDDASRRLASLLPAAGAARPPLTWQQRLRAVRDATRALVFLHTPTATRPVILHRDIKPANVLLDLEGNAKLADGVPPYPCLALALTAAVVPPILSLSHQSCETLSLSPPWPPLYSLPRNPLAPRLPTPPDPFPPMGTP